MSLGRGQPGNDAASPVVICGLGAVSGYGWGEKRLREGIFGARSAVRLVPELPERRRPAWLALVQDDEDDDDATRQARATRFAVGEALADAQDRGWRPRTSTGLVHAGRVPDAQATARLMDEFELNGPQLALAGGPTSGLLGLLTAQCLIDGSLAGDVVVLCSDFSATTKRVGDRGEPALVVERPPASACRPFQEGSVGANPGEAAVAMVVSQPSSTAYAQVRGGGFAHGPEGAGQTARLLRQALEAALVHVDVAGDEVAYVNAHGSGVPALDSAESTVVDELFGPATRLYSLKPLVGDCGVASGAVELVAALYGFSTGVVPAPVRVAPGHPRLLDGPTAAIDGAVAKASIDDTGSAAVVVLGPPTA